MITQRLNDMLLRINGSTMKSKRKIRNALSICDGENNLTQFHGTQQKEALREKFIAAQALARNKKICINNLTY